MDSAKEWLQKTDARFWLVVVPKVVHPSQFPTTSPASNHSIVREMIPTNQGAVQMSCTLILYSNPVLAHLHFAGMSFTGNYVDTFLKRIYYFVRTIIEKPAVNGI